MTNDVTQLMNFVNMLLRMFLRAPGMLIGAVIMAISMNPSLAVVLAVTMPLLILGKQVKPVNLGTRSSFADIAATVAQLLDVQLDTPGKSFAEEIL